MGNHNHRAFKASVELAYRIPLVGQRSLDELTCLGNGLLATCFTELPRGVRFRPRYSNKTAPGEAQPAARQNPQLEAVSAGHRTLGR